MKNSNFLTFSLTFFLYFIALNFNLFAQSAIIENKSASEKHYKYETFEIKSIKNSKLSKKQLQDLNTRIKIAFFSENINIKEKEVPTISLTIPQILKSYTDAVKESFKESEIHYGVTSISYQIIYNKNGILSLAITNQFMGAHPVINTNNYTFSLNTGEIIENKDIFISKEQQEEFLPLVGKKIKERVAKKAKELEKSEADELLSKELRLFNLDFNITEKGITFIHDFDLPYIMKALEPETDYDFSWAELAKFVNKNGVLIPFYAKK